MRECWAAVLGDCRGKITGEHYVSQAAFITERITVEGFAWCKDAPNVIGLASATANVLCEHHNSKLSELDAAAGQAIQVLRDSVALDKSRRRLKVWEVPKHERFTIDAARVERWMLKTLLNLVHGPGIAARHGVPAGGMASLEQAELCYGLRPFSGHAGMHFAAHEGLTFSLQDALSFRPAISDGVIVGAWVEFHGLRFILNLDAARRPDTYLQIHGSPRWGETVLKKPLEHIYFKRLSYPSHTLDFDWSAKKSLQV